MVKSLSELVFLRLGKLRQGLRQLLCPLDQLVQYVPTGASVLDVGCGGGVFLITLAEMGRLCEGHGIDRCARAIDAAKRLMGEYPTSPELRFETVDSLARVPDDRYDVVSLIDVVHHIPPRQQTAFFMEAALKLRLGGTLIYKDISASHRFWGFCNALHDLLAAGQIVHYVPEGKILEAAHESGLERRVALSRRKFWYMHTIQVFRKSGPLAN